MNCQRVMVIAGEASGDRLAAELIKALKEGFTARELKQPSFFGAGGPAMAEVGVDVSVDMTQHAVIGLGDVLRNYGKFKRIFNELLALAMKREPELIILTDFSGFNRRFAKAVRDYLRSNKLTSWSPKIVQYVSPQVWASRPSRAEKMAKDVDLLLCIFPFEKDWYAKRVPNFKVEFVGHPIFDRYASTPSPNAVPMRSVSISHVPTILLLPGSRYKEIDRHMPVMLDAVALILRKRRAKFRMILPTEELAAHARSATAKSLLPKEINFEVGGLAAALSEADAALASTGTVLVECAYFRVPTVAMYKTSWTTFQIGKRIVQVKYLAMPNLLANEEVFPEFIQDAATPENISRAALDLLNNETRRAKIDGQLQKIISSLGGPGGSKRAADAMLDLISPDTRFPNLRQFLGGYFHQDWDIEHKDEPAVVAAYLNETPISQLEEVSHEIEELLGMNWDQLQLNRFSYTTLLCSFDPSPSTMEEWLKSLRHRIRSRLQHTD